MYVFLVWFFLSLSRQLGSYRRIPQTFLFLLAYFIFADGMSTALLSIGVFGIVELDLNFQQVVWGSVVASVAAVVSTFLFLFW